MYVVYLFIYLESLEAIVFFFFSFPYQAINNCSILTVRTLSLSK